MVNVIFKCKKCGKSNKTINVGGLDFIPITIPEHGLIDTLICDDCNKNEDGEKIEWRI